MKTSRFLCWSVRCMIHPIIKLLLYTGWNGVSLLDSSYPRETFFHLLSFAIARYRWDSFTLLYDLDAHGESVNTFFAKCQDKGQTILVCLTDKGEILGGMLILKWLLQHASYRLERLYPCFYACINFIQVRHFMMRVFSIATLRREYHQWILT